MKQKELKSQVQNNIPEITDDSFVEFINEEREIKMDLSFNDFMKKVEEEKPAEKSNSKTFNLYWVTSLVACLVLVFGLAFLYNKENVQVNNAVSPTVEIVNHELEIKEEIHDEVIVKEEMTTEEISKPLINLTKTVSKKRIEINSEARKPEIELPIENESEYDEFVIVNGEKIEDQKKAQQIALDALKLFAINMDKGAEAVGQLKKLAVEY